MSKKGVLSLTFRLSNPTRAGIEEILCADVESPGSTSHCATAEDLEVNPQGGPANLESLPSDSWCRLLVHSLHLFAAVGCTRSDRVVTAHRWYGSPCWQWTLVPPHCIPIAYLRGLGPSSATSCTRVAPSVPYSLEAVTQSVEPTTRCTYCCVSGGESSSALIPATRRA